MFLHRKVLLPVLAVLSTAGLVFGQAGLDLVPQCPLGCLVQGIQGSECSPADTACTCADTVLQSTVQTCVLANCTVTEGLQLKNFTMTNCGAPHRDHSGNYKVLSNVMGSLAAVFVAQRFAFKLYSKMPLMLDDWFTLATMLSTVPSMVINTHGVTEAGLGRDLWTLTPKQITDFGRFFYLLAIFYFTQVALLKLSMLFFYMRIFPAKATQNLIWGTVIFDCLFGLAYVLIAIFQCRPIYYFWIKWDRQHEGQCLDINSVTWSNAAISIALDGWMIAIPLWHLHRLQLDWRKKIGVALMFIVGTFVTIVSILRLRSLITFGKDSDNITWSYLEVSTWSTIEITVGIICVCMPTLRLLLVRLFPKIFATTRNAYAKYGSSNERSHGHHSRGQSRMVSARGDVSASRSTPSYPMQEMGDGYSTDRIGNDGKNTILHQTTITVEYEDEQDEQRLVRPERYMNTRGGKQKWNDVLGG